MASQVDRLMAKDTGVNPNLSENHIRCFCHKIALILNAGLQEIQLSARGLVQSQSKTLGYVPNLVPIVKESEEIEEEAHFVAEDVILGSNVNSQMDNSADQEENLEVVESDDADSSETPVKKSDYSSWSKKLEIDGPSLIAGYGIRWNIKYESRNQGYQGCKIIGKLLENEKDRQERKGGKNYHNNTEISRHDWEVVNRLNETLSGLFEAKVIEVQEASASLLEKSATPAGKQSSNKAEREEFDYFPEAVAAPVVDELSIYLAGKHKLLTSQASQCLEW
ncbi:hypothetical protein PCASD_10014 [Puccinia coronata f. sp. avenae]|uniref:HAT C-terminal dimerisation domain-containing protein n=2 Tax=Puccinia coronata f. sp. avenae TaxID=200324 RepID=A0A2N5UK27_9BASI|nr:hypothetical protein PCASD_10014 [Puccinia coronata f. sp. avenae]